MLCLLSPKQHFIAKTNGDSKLLMQVGILGYGLGYLTLFSSVPEPFIKSCEHGKCYAYDDNDDLATGDADDDQGEGTSKLQKKNY